MCFKNIFYLLICGNLLFSCNSSTQVISNRILIKRKYNKGWYADRKSHKLTPTIISDTGFIPSLLYAEQCVEINDNKLPLIEPLPVIENRIDNIKHKKNYSSEYFKDVIKINFNNTQFNYKINKSSIAKIQDPPEEPKEKKNNVYGIISVLIFIWPIIFFSLSALLSPFSIADALIDFLGAITFLSIPVGIILLIMANSKTKKNPEKYKKVGVDSIAIKITLWISLILLALVVWLSLNSILMLSDIMVPGPFWFFYLLIIPTFVVGYLFIRKQYYK